MNHYIKALLVNGKDKKIFSYMYAEQSGDRHTKILILITMKIIFFMNIHAEQNESTMNIVEIYFN